MIKGIGFPMSFIIILMGLSEITFIFINVVERCGKIWYFLLRQENSYRGSDASEYYLESAGNEE